MRNLSFLCFLGLLSIGCGGKPAPSGPQEPIRFYGGQGVRESLNTFIQKPLANSTSMPIFYVTNRAKGTVTEPCNNKTFTPFRSDITSFGSCEINVPRNHIIGSLPLPTADSDNPHDYFIGTSNSVLASEDFFKKLQSYEKQDVLAFVHGFNVGFQESVYRAAQIAYDLKFQGPVVVFSWPAGSSSGIFEEARLDRTYGNNQINAKKTISAIAEFMQLLSQKGKTVHLMVHSMGHQVLIPALAEVAKTATFPFIGELILNAPDIDTNEFKTAIPALQKISKRITVYCSINDRAMTASQLFNSTQRLGACANIPEVDIINVSDIDAPILGLGHGYYASRIILTDIYQALLGVETDKRLFIRQSNQSSEKFYLRP